jgi:hypothetical protein
MKSRFSLKALALVVGASFLFAVNASAQTNPLSTNGNVTLKLDLRNVLELTILKSETSVIFNTVAEYENGTDSTEVGQFKVSSNIPFEIKVASSSASFANGGNTIPLSVMQIKSTANSDTDPSATPTITLTQADQVLVSTSAGCINRTYDFNYKATPTATGSVTGNEFITSPTGVYSATLVYTIAQK